MATPYQDDREKKTQVRTMFDRIAPWYDFLNRFLSLGIDRRWRRKAIRQLGPTAPDRILDVATGTGDLAIESKRQFPDARITGVDIASRMVDIGNRKIRRKGLADIKLQLGDSENLDFSDNTFDAITVAFGVRNFQNLEKGLREMQRVLAPGGRLVVLEFSRPRVFPIKQMFGLYFKFLLPKIGRLFSRDKRAYSYLYESVQEFPDYGAFEEKLRQTGYNALYYKPLTLGICCLYVAEKSR